MRVALALTLALFASGLTQAQDRIQITLDKEPLGDLRLDWQDSCSRAGTDYAIHEGTLGSFNSHTSLQCSTAGANTTTVSPLASNSYYLVVPLDAGAEGSYGQDSYGNERSVGMGTCEPQQIVLPCVEDNFLSASAARVARLDAVIAAAATLIETGGSYTDVANMLANEGDVTNVSSNGVSLYFTVDGLPTSIYDTVAARHGGPLREIIPPAGGAAAAEANRQMASGPSPASSVASMLPLGQRMVGDDDDGDGKRDLPKHARVLSPWAFDFSPNDSAPRVRDILNGVRDYQEGSVVYKDNTQDLIAATMTLADYTDGWDDLDIIFISSHGEADPNSGWGPDPYIYLGIGGSTCAAIRAKILAENPAASTIPGLHCSGSIVIGPSSNPIVGIDTIGASAFWSHVHGGNLSKKLIYFDACRTSFLPGLAEALTGPDSIFLGWSEYVGPAVSVASADAVISKSAVDAFPVLRSFVSECGAGQCTDTVPTAELLASWDRADLRTREGLSIPGISDLGFCGLSPTQPLSLTCPSCGGGNQIGLSTTFSFVLEGTRPEEMALIQDPFDFGKYQLRLFADVDGVESGYAQPLYDLNTIYSGNGVWSDLLPITLAIPDACPYDVVEYQPWVLLPTFDEAMPGNDGRDRIYSWDGPFTIEVDPILLP